MIWSQKKYGIPATPNYAALTGADVFDSTGLVYNATNSYGQVNSFGVVVLWKSLINSSKTFTGIDSKGAGNLYFEKNKRANVIHNTGAGLFRQASAVQSRTDFSYLWHHASGFSSMRWTVHCVAKFGMEDFYGSLFSILANNQGGAARPGVLIYQGDRLAASQDDTVSVQITKATAGNIINSTNNNKVTSGSWHLVTIEFNGSLGATNSVILYVDGVLQTITTTSASTTTNITNLDALEIMGLGGAALTTTSFKMSHLIIQNVVESSGVRNTIMSELGAWTSYFNESDNGNEITTSGQLTKLIQENRYYLTAKIIQDVTDDNKMVTLFTNGTNANGNAGKRLSIIKSTNYGKTWGAISTVYDPAGTEFVQCSTAGVTPANKYVCIFNTNVNTSGTVIANPTKLYVTFSTDQGATWSAPVDITSSVPSDSLNNFSCESQVICNNGRILFVLNKQTDPGVSTNSANYCMYSDDDGATWATTTIRASHSDYVTEAACLHLGGDNIYVLIGSYQDNEWRCFTSSDNGDTWTYEGLMDFTTSDTTPSTLHKFKINNTEVARFNYYVHGSFTYKSSYALVADLLTDPLTAWALKQVTMNQFIMHGDFCHYNNGIETIFVTPVQPDTFSGTIDSMGYGYGLVPVLTSLVP